MASNTREYYKKQLEEMTIAQLLEVMHGTPIGLMSTNVGSDRMKIALELIQERWNILESRIRAIETGNESFNYKSPGPKAVKTVTVTLKKRGPGRPKGK